jgi:hypothetical protein
MIARSESLRPRECIFPRVCLVFSTRRIKVVVDSRKIACIKRSAKKPGGIRRAYYIPLYSSEISHLGISENSLFRAEISRLERSDSSSRPAHELEAELNKIRSGIAKILNEYSDKTGIRKHVLITKLSKVLNGSGKEWKNPKKS